MLDIYLYINNVIQNAFAYWTGGYDAGAGVILPPGFDNDANLFNRSGLWQWDGNQAPWNFMNWDSNSPDSSPKVSTCVQIFADAGKWSNENCATKQKAICQKVPIINVTPDPDKTCSGPGCCTGHVGVENGGIIPDSAFSARGF